MLFFWSEEHVERWIEKTGIARGESFTIAQAWQLARDLYGDRLSPDWRRKSPEEYELMFRRAGLTSNFWKLT